MIVLRYYRSDLAFLSFVGGNQFCFKACFNSVSSPDYCENRYDLLGCSYNMPSAAKDGEFTECDSDLQDPAGIYTSNGAGTSHFAVFLLTMVYPICLCSHDLLHA